MRPGRILKRVGLALLIVLVPAAVVVTLVVERESDYRDEDLGGPGPAQALVLYHPSRDAHFADDLSLAVAEGFKLAGYRVHRATLTGSTPGSPAGYAILAVVSNTYWFTPDLPTRRYLGRARLTDLPTIGIIGGAGSTGRSERVLGERLRRTGARVLALKSLWLWRPNDEQRMDQPNREVALDQARRLALEASRSLGADAPTQP